MAYFLLSWGPASKQTEVVRWQIIATTALTFCPSVLLYLWVGLETIFYTSLLTCAIIALANHGQNPSRAVAAGIFLALASLTRLESTETTVFAHQ